MKLFLNYFFLPLFLFVEIMCEALYLSVDPYMRPYSLGWPLGMMMMIRTLMKINSEH